MDLFVKKNSIVRRIWGKADVILFIFAGAAAEFALNKAVDWLYFTGRLPSDPLGRLFSTVKYARTIVFSDKEKAFATIDKMAVIHNTVETRRGSKIPDWAYRDVLFMLIDYSIRSYELLERRLNDGEKTEVFDVFNQVGLRMGIKDLPQNYIDWVIARNDHLMKNLVKSNFTVDLFKQYKNHLGAISFFILKEAQLLVIPNRVKQLLNFRKFSLLTPVVPVYKVFSNLKLDWIIKEVLLPRKYKAEIKELDII